MRDKLLKKYHPYEGDEPFLFLSFADQDAKAVEPLLEQLWQRGVRVWYTIGSSESLKQEKAVQARMKQAGLVVAICSRAFLEDTAKARAMSMQAQDIPLIIVDIEPADNLATGIREGTVHIDAHKGITEETEWELVTCDAFSQDYIGPRQKAESTAGVRLLFAAVLTLMAAALVFSILLHFGLIQPKAENVTTLTLQRIPENPEELERYPNLEKIIIPQAEIENAGPLLNRYIVVVKGA